MAATEKAKHAQEFPRDNLVRSVFPGALELRDGGGVDGSLATMDVGFLRYNEWTEIASYFEGNFMERIAPGAATKTIKENTPQMRVLFNHGGDPQIGDKVLGPIREIVDGPDGPTGVVSLLDTSYNRDLLPGLRANVYGSSFRFRVMREEIEEEPGVSASNPKGLPERTITEAQIMEFGPVTFPAYANATAGVRSLTDQYRVAQFVGGLDREQIARMDTEDLATLAEMIQLGADYIGDQDEPDDQKNVPVMEQVLKTLASLVPVEVDETEPDEAEDEMASASTGTDVQTREVVTAGTPPDEAMKALTTPKAAPSHPTHESRRDTQTDERRANNEDERKDLMDSIEEMRARQVDIENEQKEIASEHRGNLLPAPLQTRWDALDAEWEDLDARCKATLKRDESLQRKAQVPGATEDGADSYASTGVYVTKRDGRDKTPEDPFDMAGYHRRANDQQHMMRLLGEGARRAIETFDYPHPRAKREDVNTHIEGILRQDSPNKEIASRILATGSELYHRAFFKHITSQPMTQEEQRALAVGAVGTGQAAVPIDLDPTLIPTSNQSLNPLRAISRVFTTTSYIWEGVTSGGVTAQYRAEAATMSDNSPTLTQPTIQPERVDCFVPFSYEVGQDWGALESSLADEIQDAKDQLEAVKFAVGAGHSSNEPQGILTGASTVVGSSAATAFSVADVYALENALPARHLPAAKWVSTIGMFQKIRQFDTAGGASLWVQLQTENPPELIGYPAYRATNVGTAGPSLATTVKWGVFGNFSRYGIVDRIGMSVRVIPDLFSGNTAGGIAYPRGQSGLIAFWRNSAGVLDANAFRTGTIT